MYHDLYHHHVPRLLLSCTMTSTIMYRAPPWSSGSVLDHRSLPPVFESRRGHIWRLFRLLLRLIIFGGRSAQLAYLMHKSGRKTSIIIIYQHVWRLVPSSRSTTCTIAMYHDFYLRVPWLLPSSCTTTFTIAMYHEFYHHHVPRLLPSSCTTTSPAMYLDLSRHVPQLRLLKLTCTDAVYLIPHPEFGIKGTVTVFRSEICPFYNDEPEDWKKLNRVIAIMMW